MVSVVIHFFSGEESFKLPSDNRRYEVSRKGTFNWPNNVDTRILNEHNESDKTFLSKVSFQKQRARNNSKSSSMRVAPMLYFAFNILLVGLARWMLLGIYYFPFKNYKYD